MSSVSIVKTVWVIFVCALLLPVSLAIAADSSPRTVERFFLTGHSLTDDPLGGYITAIGASVGKRPIWNQQIVIGSPIEWRTHGDRSKGVKWAGYGYGKGRITPKINVLYEFQSKKTKAPYDTLIIAEGHNTVAAIRWNDTVRNLRHYHDRFIDHNASGVTFLFEPWESIKDRQRIAPWISLERQATKVWGCVANRINESLVVEQRDDRVRAMPIGHGLAELLDAASGGGKIALAQTTPPITLERVFDDDVHLKKLGIYYVALLSHVTMTGRPVTGAWAPQGVSTSQAYALQVFAWQFYQANVRNRPSLSRADCRTFMVETFCDAWNAYVPNKNGDGKQTDCKEFFGQTKFNPEDPEVPAPFADSTPEQDAVYWLSYP